MTVFIKTKQLQHQLNFAILAMISLIDAIICVGAWMPGTQRFVYTY